MTGAEIRGGNFLLAANNRLNVFGYADYKLGVYRTDSRADMRRLAYTRNCHGVAAKTLLFCVFGIF